MKRIPLFWIETRKLRLDLEVTPQTNRQYCKREWTREKYSWRLRGVGNKGRSLFNTPIDCAVLRLTKSTWWFQRRFSWKITPKNLCTWTLSIGRDWNVRGQGILVGLFLDVKMIYFVFLTLSCNSFASSQRESCCNQEFAVAMTDAKSVDEKKTFVSSP